MEGNCSLVRRSASERLSFRSSKRLARSTSGISPLARNLLRSLHEQKRAALAEQRARRWEIYSVVNNVVLSQPNPVHLSVERDDQTVRTCIDQSEFPMVDLLYEEARKYDVQQKSSKKVVLIKLKTVKKQVSSVVTRIFPRKTKKRQIATACSSADGSQLKSFRMLQSTVL